MNGGPKPYPGTFAHGIDPAEWYPAWNLALCGRLLSPDFAALSDPGLSEMHRSLRDVPLEEIRKGSVQLGVVSPRSAWCVVMAGIVRRGGKVGTGVVNTTWLTREGATRLVKTGDVELEFERVRRQIAPSAVSRLACLYVADDSDSGRQHIVSMLGRDVLILRVCIPLAMAVTKVDTAWWDAYCDCPKAQHIENYWQSLPKTPDAPIWEYLVDGLIQAEDPEVMDWIRKHGAHLKYLPHGPEDSRQ